MKFVPYLLGVCSAYLTLSTVTAQSSSAPSNTPPNIVLIFADDLGINDLSCYGRADHRTPNLNKLAESGMRFTSAYTAQPICSPSRAALMTGKSPARLHITNFLPGRADAPSQRLLQPIIEGQLPLEEQTIAEWLKSAGYTTGLFGKWHLGSGPFGPQYQGFDVVFSPPANSKPSNQEGGKSEYAITNAAVEFIKGNADKPFFCYIPHNNPHIPLSAKPELIESNRNSFHPVYAAMIETLDDTIGIVMRTVEEAGLQDNTIFIFTSDNGGLHVLESPSTPATHNTPYRAGKGFLYEGGLREPLIIRWPGKIASNSLCETPVLLTDLVPTLLESAGIDLAKTVGPLDGISLLPALQGMELPRRNLHWHFPHYTNQGSRPAGAIRKDNWKLIRHYEDSSVELYDLDRDPGETNNAVASQPELVAEMNAQLDKWLVSVGAQTMLPNPEFEQTLYDRLYVQQDPSRLAAGKSAAEMEPLWKQWRSNMNAAVKGRKAKVTPPEGDIRLLARDATVHAKTMRYESPSNKDVLGYWTNPDDWAEWQLEISTAGKYEIEILQGCGSGSGGAQVDIVIADQALSFIVVETGHFQKMAQRTIGTVTLPSGSHTLAVKPKTKPGIAVMDLRRVVLRPIP